MLLPIFVLGSCTEGDVIETFAKEVNKECPIALSSVNNITAVEFENKTLTYRITMDEEFTNITALSKHISTLRLNALAMITGSDGNVRKLYEAAAGEGVSVRFVYIGSLTGQETSVLLSSYQIERALNEKKETGISALEAEIKFANISLPIDTGDGLIVRKVGLYDNTVYYVYDVNEDLISMSELKKNASECKRGLIRDFKESSVEEKKMFEMMFEEGCSLACKYKGTTTGKEVTIIIDNNEIAEILR
jgi:hypothetical protein